MASAIAAVSAVIARRTLKSITFDVVTFYPPKMAPPLNDWGGLRCYCAKVRKLSDICEAKSTMHCSTFGNTRQEGRITVSKAANINRNQGALFTGDAA
ncbi:hypothetical protein E1B25_08885 [Antarcticimicrobium sediminis]|uniref:Uncharacterized protein n=1 Tax=Antarcticimicrobium sediminis TaxID=2546227 RepID=A0A4V6PG88_9RHOB|nr:hypothetical protein E1B25_08885 [Antarcticimicrobium sediminis]